MIKDKRWIVYVVLFVILIFAGLLRFYKLDQNPPSITWDEASVGYNAFAIANWGKDEWGKILPLTFKSFGDDKNPVHVYATVPFVAIFGLNDYSVRASTALFGSLNVLAIYFLIKKLLKNDISALLASFFWAVSPTALHFSRFNHEMQFALFFAISGFYFLFEGIEKSKKFIPLGFLFLGIDLLTYQSAKVVTLPLVIFLIIINFKNLVKCKKYFAVGLVIYFFFVSLLFINPKLLGTARFEQNKIVGDSMIKMGIRYLEYFKPSFLFISGDSNPRHSIQTIGHFYWFDLFFIFLSFFGLVKKLLKKEFNILIFFVMLFLAPLPAAVSNLTTHAPRAMFMILGWIVLMSLGFDYFTLIFRKKLLIGILLLFTVGVYSFFFHKYLNQYFTEYPKKYAIEWVYGMRQIAEFVNTNDFHRVYVTDARSQPYIFSLFYEKTNLLDFLNTVKYNNTISNSYNLVKSFGKYRFMWDDYHSQPVDGVLYVVKPSVYIGLYEKDYFDVAKLIKYPNGTDAFYLIVSEGTKILKNE